MVFQYRYGHLLSMNASAGEKLPYYRFVEIVDGSKFFLATGKHPIVGVTVPSVHDDALLKDGTRKKRNSYIPGEEPMILHTGVCYVELEDSITRGDYIIPGMDGKARRYTYNNDNDVDLIELDDSDSKTSTTPKNKKKSKIDSINRFKEHFSIKGMALNTKNNGELVEISLSII